MTLKRMFEVRLSSSLMLNQYRVDLVYYSSFDSVDVHWSKDFNLLFSLFIARWILNEQKKGGSESCHHDINHDMVYTCSLSRIITTIQTNSPSWMKKGVCRCFQTRITRLSKRNFQYVNGLNKLHLLGDAERNTSNKWDQTRYLLLFQLLSFF